MFINLNNLEFINIETIQKASVEQGVLRILFLTGDETIYFDKRKINKIIKQLKIKANESI